MRFYLTTHKRHWVRLTDVPLFLKSEHFVNAVKLDEARGPYAVDSGGFSELQRRGRWTRTPRQYIEDLRRIWECVGPYDWAAPQDWMCEDLIIHGGTAGPNVFVGTHLSVREHIRRTVANFLELRSLAPELRIAPVLQGRTIADYEWCAELYERAGVDLTREPTVGLGSVCRLQSTREGAAIVTAMAARGLKLHGFGFLSPTRQMSRGGADGPLVVPVRHLGLLPLIINMVEEHACKMELTDGGPADRSALEPAGLVMRPLKRHVEGGRACRTVCSDRSGHAWLANEPGRIEFGPVNRRRVDGGSGLTGSRPARSPRFSWALGACCSPAWQRISRLWSPKINLTSRGRTQIKGLESRRHACRSGLSEERLAMCGSM
ncbi:hypothetical protein ACFWZY_32125 [Streptomyces sp. NPDC058992]|uniref:deazapurine DNA modification protein DpdA family protein n=1 Tax=Streptomyces sp. NPDC058992 TaxID=3346688 RepID=UPI0036C8DCDC